MKPSRPIHVLRSAAKKAAREQSIKLGEALDRIAREEGYLCWSLLSARNPKTVEKPNDASGKFEITTLPLGPADHATFIEWANAVFETVMDRMEPDNPELTRKLWNAEHYVDEVLLRQDMLPIDRDYALSLIDAFLVHHVLDLAVRADRMASR